MKLNEKEKAGLANLKKRMKAIAPDQLRDDVVNLFITRKRRGFPLTSDQDLNDLAKDLRQASDKEICKLWLQDREVEYRDYSTVDLYR